MRTSRWLVALAGLLAGAGIAAAQRGRGPYDYLADAGFGYSRVRGPSALAVRFGVRRYYFAPLGPFYGPPINRVTIVNVLPPPPPPPIFVFQAPPQQPPAAPPEKERRLDTPDRTDVFPPPPGKEKDATDPEELKARPKEPPKEQPKKAPPPSRKRDGEPVIPRPPAPADDPVEEHARLVQAGRAAFLAQEYGRAAWRKRWAARLLPDDAEPSFLLAQALLAQGKYRDAYDAVRAGLLRRPDWPAARFRPLSLYGPNVRDYSALLRGTEKALSRHPDDPELLFLRGYVLWFDGRKEEARPLLRQALPRSADRDLIDRFLRALPDSPEF
jgi:hypothetical protein